MGNTQAIYITCEPKGNNRKKKKIKKRKSCCSLDLIGKNDDEFSTLVTEQIHPVRDTVLLQITCQFLSVRQQRFPKFASAADNGLRWWAQPRPDSYQVNRNLISTFLRSLVVCVLFVRNATTLLCPPVVYHKQNPHGSWFTQRAGFSTKTPPHRPSWKVPLHSP